MTQTEIQQLLFSSIRWSLVVFCLFYAAANFIIFLQVRTMNAQISTRSGAVLFLIVLASTALSMAALVISVLFALA